MAKARNDLRPIIIKRVKKVEGGHHGGAWKVAYADFATAMMAFFMLLWLLTTSEKVTLTGLADYFTPSAATMSASSGSGSILAGTALESEGAKSSDSVAMAMPTTSTEAAAEDRPETDAQADISPPSSWESKLPTEGNQQLLRAEDALRTAIQETPELEDYKDQILVEQTPDGLRIQLIDRDQRPMFRSGTAELYGFAQTILRRIGMIVEGLPNRIAIQGHTDAAGATADIDYGNWELSADRANSARRVLRRAGVRVDRFAEVVGKAATDPLYPDDPLRAENRRMTILLLREAPVLDPAFGARD